MRVLHIASDEKFIDQARRAFEEVAPSQNDFIIYCNAKLKHITFSPLDTFDSKKKLRKFVIDEAAKYELVVFHSLLEQWVKVINNMDTNVKAVWIGWGFDYYDLITPDPRDLLLPNTVRLLPLTSVLKAIYHKLRKYREVFGGSKKIKAIQRLTYFSPVLKQEYFLLKSARKFSKFPDYISWNYGNLEDDLLKGFINKKVSGDNILVGNSATVTNNHIDAFLILKNADLSNRKIITPLGYGNERNKERMRIVGNDILGESYQPILGFMAIQRYVELLQSCGFVIMNHVRQQGLGNIVIMLYLGAKVFLRKENPLYKYFKDHGAIVYSVQELEEDYSLLSGRLDEASASVNRAVIVKNWSRMAMHLKTKQFIETVTQSRLTADEAVDHL